MPLRSLLRLASLTALSIATLSACASASSLKPAPAPSPAVIERAKTVAICPAEVRAAVAPVPKVPDGAVITANAAGHGWLSDLVAYGQAAFARETDAQAACEKVNADG